MQDKMILEKRLQALEHAVADLQQQVAGAVATGNWIEKVAGSISDESAFLEALEYGRAYRHADRPSDDAHGQP
jgi:hypothetical protein